MRPFCALIVAAGLLVLVPSAHAAPPALCTASVIETTLAGAGQELGGEGVDLIRCGDVTGDGATDAVFTVASGGTAGDIHFGVIEGSGDGGEVVLYKDAYKVGIARHSKTSFDVLQPFYGAHDPNCCPSSFRQTRYTWTGTKFKAGKAKKLKTAPKRFYRS
jgi:hypothetical protein